MIWNQHLGNILTVYAHADRVDIATGMGAFQGYNALMKALATEFRQSEENVTGVFAALSPNSDYKTNVSSARTMLAAHNRGAAIDDFKVTTYKNNKRKAWSILEGRRPLDVIVAKKTRSFYLNIIAPFHPWPVTIDGHMYSVWMLKRFNMIEAQVGSGKKYDRISSDFRLAAKAVGILPNQLQAICWFTWKRVNRISFDVKLLQHELWPGKN